VILQQFTGQHPHFVANKDCYGLPDVKNPRSLIKQRGFKLSIQPIKP